MDPEIGKVVVIAITAVGAVAWLAGLAAVLRAEPRARESALPGGRTIRLEGELARARSSARPRSRVIPRNSRAKLAGLLAREGIGPFGPVKIVARDRRRGGLRAGRSVDQLGFRGGRIRLTPVGLADADRVRPRDLSSGLLIGGWIALALGLAALIAAPCSGVRLRPAQPEPERPGPGVPGVSRWSISSGRRSCSPSSPASPPGCFGPGWRPWSTTSPILDRSTRDPLDPSDTIAAIASPAGPGLRGMVRVTGPEAWAVALDGFEDEAGETNPPDQGRATAGRLRVDGLRRPLAGRHRALAGPSDVHGATPGRDPRDGLAAVAPAGPVGTAWPEGRGWPSPGSSRSGPSSRAGST